jgi:glycosyltransferase involved in cell wall biosynthesis
MDKFPIFLSLVTVVRNQEEQLRSIATDLATSLAGLASDFELIIVDNASNDGSVEAFRDLVSSSGVPNLQVYALTKEVDPDTACSVGLENALGDFIAFIDPMTDDVAFLPAMLDKAVGGYDVVFATNERKKPQGLVYRASARGFNSLYARLTGVDLDKDAPQFRVLSRRVANFILQHPLPSVTYRYLPATGGFARTRLTYSSPPRSGREKRLAESIDRGIRLLVTTTRAPMRLVTWLSFFGAIANVVYSGYVVAVALLKEDVAPGWVTLSLQQSGMFLLVCVVLLVLGEYILQMASLTSEGPRYHIGQEFTSATLTRRMKLNVEKPQTEPYVLPRA